MEDSSVCFVCSLQSSDALQYDGIRLHTVIESIFLPNMAAYAIQRTCFVYDT